MSKYTGWFPAGTKPARIGVYQTRIDIGYRRIFYQHWNGEFWGLYGIQLDVADRWRVIQSSIQRPEWRGLAKEPQ